MILAAVQNLPTTESALNSLKRSLAEGEPMPSKTALLSAYHKLLKKQSIPALPALEKLLVRRAVRTLSGVTIVTSLIKPYPCPGECIYCPLDVRMPKSYLSDEPAAARALLLKFDPYEQMAKRLEALEQNGHPTDKIEFIIKGGTWNSYTLAYQYWFILESFRACNELGKKKKNNQKKFTERSSLEELRTDLKRQQHLNETAAHRIIGLTLETRPDCITPKTIWQMREMGCTRIELGVQHTDNHILELTKRGHSIEEVYRATELLKNFGFKTDFHLMPQLPEATPAMDAQMLKETFSNPRLRPDMIKIYPCSVVKGSELYDWFVQGKYHAYPTEDLIDILVDFKANVIPRYCRISRLIRDIPGQYIEEGNKVTNLRQIIHERLKKMGKTCPCLRCREIGHQALPMEKLARLKPKMFIDTYEANDGTEYFLSFEDTKRRAVFAFCRFRLNKNDAAGPYPAYIRELHTYGQLVEIGGRSKDASQHTGLGKKLMQAAEHIATKAHAKKIAVISGVGVRDYYRHLGYRLEKTYLVKSLD